MFRALSVDFQYLRECLILAFAYDTWKRRFTIISDYPELSPGSRRELIALVFNGVQRFNREHGNLPWLAHIHRRYEARDEWGHCVFEHIKTRNQDGGPNKVEFWFGYNFGGVDFEYQDLEVYRRGSRSVPNRPGSRMMQNRRGTHTIHDEDEGITRVDVETNEVFDFYNPFPQLLDVKRKN